MIARAEAGNAREGMADFDVADVARDVADLYEPVAEEAGVSADRRCPGPICRCTARASWSGRRSPTSSTTRIKYSRAAAAERTLPLT